MLCLAPYGKARTDVCIMAASHQVLMIINNSQGELELGVMNIS